MFVSPKQSIFPIVLCFFLIFTACSSNEEIIEEPVIEKAPIIEEEVVVKESLPTLQIESSSFENEILVLINEYRKSINLPAIKVLNLIKVPAFEHTLYMIARDQLSHDQFTTRANYLVEKANIISAAENVASGYGTAESVVKGWIASEGHRKNIEGDFNYFNVVARKNSKGNWYYTNIFVKKR